MSGTYTPVYGVRCAACGAWSWIAGRLDPGGMRWKCPAHGDEGAGFVETGVGEVGRDYEVREFLVVDVTADTVEATLSPEPFEVDEVRFEDYEAVEVDGVEPNEQAERRGVTGGTVRSNVESAAEALGGSA
ncbi:CxxC motif protein [Halorubrum phage Hardycor1]|nr:CxxC motif protein [Halorubrum phage Hardycor1]